MWGLQVVPPGSLPDMMPSTHRIRTSCPGTSRHRITDPRAQLQVTVNSEVSVLKEVIDKPEHSSSKLGKCGK